MVIWLLPHARTFVRVKSKYVSAVSGKAWFELAGNDHVRVNGSWTTVEAPSGQVSGTLMVPVIFTWRSCGGLKQLLLASVAQYLKAPGET